MVLKVNFMNEKGRWLSVFGIVVTVGVICLVGGSKVTIGKYINYTDVVMV